jgi:hypothetical protein
LEFVIMSYAKSFALAATFVAAALVASGCGGGDDSEGGTTALTAVPSELTVTWPDSQTCGASYAGRVFVYGGAGPYRLDNTSPDSVVLSKSRLSGPGDFVDVNFTGRCLDTATIVVVDQTNRTTQFTLSNVAGGASGSPPPSR